MARNEWYSYGKIETDHRRTSSVDALPRVAIAQSQWFDSVVTTQSAPVTSYSNHHYLFISRSEKGIQLHNGVRGVRWSEKSMRDYQYSKEWKGNGDHDSRRGDLGESRLWSEEGETGLESTAADTSEEVREGVEEVMGREGRKGIRREGEFIPPINRLCQYGFVCSNCCTAARFPPSCSSSDPLAACRFHLVLNGRDELR